MSVHVPRRSRRPSSGFQYHHGLRKDQHGVREEWRFPVEEKLDELP